MAGTFLFYDSRGRAQNGISLLARTPSASHTPDVRLSAFLKMNRANRAATLADVGREAGVSAMAASAVLNGARTSSRIAPETRERILAAAAKLRYRPNATARALANRRMNTIGVAGTIDGESVNHYLLEILSGILSSASAHQQNTTVFTLHDWERDAERLHDFCDGRIDGLILLAPMLTRAQARLLPSHTPFVSLHGNTPMPHVLNIESDEEHGAYLAVRALVQKGHRRILHFAGSPGRIGAERRIAGFKRALSAAGFPFDESLIVTTGFTTEEGRMVMRRWLSAHTGQPLPTAVFCANDGVAIGCTEALAEVGIRVPEDISVIGFDDTFAARSTAPQLTTIRQPLRAMGSRAVDLLLERIGASGAPQLPEDVPPVVFPVELIERASTSVPPSTDRLIPAASVRA